MKELITVDVKKCQRCGADHDDMVFYKLVNPIDDWTY